MGGCLGKQKSGSGKEQPLLQDSHQDMKSSSEYPYDAEVTFDFLGSDQNQLTVQRNEIIIIMDASPKLNGWALAKRKDDHRQGYIPLDYTRKIKANELQNNYLNNHMSSVDESKKTSLFEAERIESLLFKELDQVDNAIKSKMSKENNDTQINGAIES